MVLKEIQNVNEAIYQEGVAHPEMQGMGTTIVSTALLDDKFVLAHVGDSRAYLIQNNQLQQLTDDHSLVNELLKSGEITKEMAAVHPQKCINSFSGDRWNDQNGCLRARVPQG